MRGRVGCARRARGFKAAQQLRAACHLLPRVVPHHPDVHAHGRSLRRQGHLPELHELQPPRVEAHKPKVVHCKGWGWVGGLAGG